MISICVVCGITGLEASLNMADEKSHCLKGEHLWCKPAMTPEQTEELYERLDKRIQDFVEGIET